MQVTVFLVGYDESDAVGSFIFDSQESAESFVLDNPGMSVYGAQARVDLDTMEKVS